MSTIGPINGASGINKAGYASMPGAVNNNAAGQAASAENSNGDSSEVQQMKRLGIVECQTCANRTYQDGSDDPGVSFKSPTKMKPSQAASAVPSHEREHFNRESSKADEDKREVVSNSIRIFTSVCPECGKTYVSGGVTTTVTKPKDSDKNDLMGKLFGTSNNNENDPNSVFNVNLKIANSAFGLNYDKKK